MIICTLRPGGFSYRYAAEIAFYINTSSLILLTYIYVEYILFTLHGNMARPICINKNEVSILCRAQKYRAKLLLIQRLACFCILLSISDLNVGIEKFYAERREMNNFVGMHCLRFFFVLNCLKCK